MGEGIYSHFMGFVYSPLVAAMFAPATWFPTAVGGLLWRFCNIGAFAIGLAMLLSRGALRRLDDRQRGIVWLLAIPLMLGNVDTAQANPMVIGLVMIAFAAAYPGHWLCSAAAVAFAVHLKIYQVAAALVLCVVAPRKMIVRFAIVLLLATAATFLLQKPSYVLEQYATWISTRFADNRMEYPDKCVTVDISYLLCHVARIPLDRTGYRILELLGGAAIGVFCAWSTRRNWPRYRVILSAFLLVSLWMVLLGPATEGYTYALLAPCACLCAVVAFQRNCPVWMRGFGITSYVLLLLAVARPSFAPHFLNPFVLSLQPVGALLDLVFVIGWIATDSLWAAPNLPDALFPSGRSASRRVNGSRVSASEGAVAFRTKSRLWFGNS